ncbi:MAG: ParD-like family protein [Magnetococcus sp. YQC-3]
MAVNVKISDERVAEARRYGHLYHRSLPQQIEYWSRIGKIAEENPDLTCSLIQKIVLAREETNPDEYQFG